MFAPVKGRYAPAVLALASLAALVDDTTEKVKPLAGRSILIILAIILVITFAVVLGGLGYFSPGDDEKH